MALALSLTTAIYCGKLCNYKTCFIFYFDSDCGLVSLNCVTKLLCCFTTVFRLYAVANTCALHVHDFVTFYKATKAVGAISGSHPVCTCALVAGSSPLLLTANSMVRAD